MYEQKVNEEISNNQVISPWIGGAESFKYD